jgi:maltokinase
LTTPLPVQRVHGDLHLGQTLRTVKGWKILDFEGEPAKPLEERIALDTPFRDVAGMLRSFDYAAGATLREFGAVDQLIHRAHEWSARNREAFLDGYAKATEPLSHEAEVVIRAYEADKAVYEAVYEARNRPPWLPIPLHAIERLAAEEQS